MNRRPLAGPNIFGGVASGSWSRSPSIKPLRGEPIGAAAFREAACLKFAEARAQTTYAEFCKWVKENFGIGETQAREYLKLGKALYASGAVPPAVRHPSLRQFSKARGINVSKRKPPSELREELRKIDFKALRQAELKKAEESKLRAELARRLIDVGYRLLATKLHPDKAEAVGVMA